MPVLLTLEILVDQPLILCLTQVVPLPFCQRIQISSQVVCIVNSLVFRIDITIIISFFIVRIRGGGGHVRGLFNLRCHHSLKKRTSHLSNLKLLHPLEVFSVGSDAKFKPPTPILKRPLVVGFRQTGQL